MTLAVSLGINASKVNLKARPGIVKEKILLVLSEVAYVCLRVSVPVLFLGLSEGSNIKFLCINSGRLLKRLNDLCSKIMWSMWELVDIL